MVALMVRLNPHQLAFRFGAEGASIVTITPVQQCKDQLIHSPESANLLQKLQDIILKRTVCAVGAKTRQDREGCLIVGLCSQQVGLAMALVVQLQFQVSK